MILDKEICDVESTCPGSLATYREKARFDLVGFLVDVNIKAKKSIQLGRIE
jgi:hypothetical protein